MEADTGTPPAATRRPWPVQGADPSQCHCQAQPLAGVGREAYADPAHSNLGQRAAKMLMDPIKGKETVKDSYWPRSLVHQNRNINRAGQHISPRVA